MTFLQSKNSTNNTKTTGLFSAILDSLTSLGFGGSGNHHEAVNATYSHLVNEKVRELNASSEIVSSVRRNYEKNVVRTKLNIQSKTDDATFNDEFEYLIAQWSKRGNCELTGRYYRGLAERVLVSEAEVLSGGFILRHHYSSRFKYGYKFEMLPLSAIDRNKDDFMSMLFKGIQTNKYGEITHIYIYTNNERTVSKKVRYSELTLHINIWADITQYTGVSPLAPILATLDILDAYTYEEIRGAKNRARNNIIVRTHFYSEVKKIAQEAANGKLSASQLQNIYEKMKLDENGDIYGAKYIPKEDEVVELGKGTDSIFADLDNTKKRALSAGIGMSPMSTVGEMPSSYNATLYFAQQEEGTYEIALENFVELAWREVIEGRLLKGLVLYGHIKAPSFWETPEKYQNIEFMRASSDHIDPVKTQQAHTEGLSNGTRNEIDIASSNGLDWKSNIDKEVRAELYRKEAYEASGLIYVPRNLDSKPLEINDVEE